MAERVLFSIAGEIIGSLSSPAFQEFGLVWGVNDELQKLMQMITQLHAVLLDAEQKQANSAVKVWLQGLEDVVYDADDVVDEFLTEAQRRSQVKVLKQVRTFFSSSNQLAFRIKMGHKIKDINKRLEVIASRRAFLNLEELRDDTRFITRERANHSFVPREEIIGREEDQRAIKQLLLDPDSSKNVSTISIVGFGGLGKTALTQLVFNDLQEHFDLQMWTCVSNEFQLDILVKKILRSESNDIDLLQNDLREKIDGKRYLLVLDDVWNENREEWLKLEYLLMGGAKGSRILITTRSEIVATNSGTIKQYKLRGLDEEQSWSLFKKMAFEDGKEPESQTIKTAAMEIARKCGGVPLAIRTIGGMLYSKNEETQWLNIKNKKLAKISEKENDILPTLKLSYDLLPSHLKHCFAYCSLFPPDFKISVDRLIKLWVAQGFVKSSDGIEGECLEDVGYEYYKELLWRSFFQEEKKDVFGRIKSCKMHDLMNELAITVTGGGITILDKHRESSDAKLRHVSFSNEVYLSNKVKSIKEANKIRTFLSLRHQPISSDPFVDASYYSSSYYPHQSCYSRILPDLKSLRMLDLNLGESTTLPKCLKKLQHLRYLDLAGSSKLKKLPNWVVSLENLETLDLSECYSLVELPRDIEKMANLRHLILEGCYKLVSMPRGLGEMTCLRTLDRFVLSRRNNSGLKDDGVDLGQLGRLKELRGKLEVCNLKGMSALNDGAMILKEKKHLYSLKLEWVGEEDDDEEKKKKVKGVGEEDDEEDDDEEKKKKVKGVGEEDDDEEIMLLEALRPHSNLKQLRVEYYSGLRFGSWLPDLINIVHLDLYYCRKCQHLPPLDHFPFLRHLSLRYLPNLEYISTSTPTSSVTSFFPSLNKLVLIECGNLKGWRMVPQPSPTEEEEDMPWFPCLSTLEIRGCPNLTSMPLYSILNVEYLTLVDTSWKALDVSASSSSISKVKSLEIGGNQDIECMPEGIGNLTSLQSLSVRNCPQLVSLPQGIGNLTSLQSLSVWNCPQLVSLPQGIGNLTSLLRLDISACSDSVLEDLGRLVNLQRLTIGGFQKLPKQGMGGLISLQRLDINFCRNLVSLPESMGNLTSLERLWIEDCPQLASLPDSIRGLASLKDLTILGCPIVEKRCKEGSGEDWPKIAHIPSVGIS